MNQLEQAKLDFLNKYNPNKSTGIAIKKAISASVQHNSLYLQNTSNREKSIIKKQWGEKLSELSKKYNKQQSLNVFLNDISGLVKFMNSSFHSSFYNYKHPKFGYDPGFRISHGQKSLSVFLKHLWCMNEIVEPPSCPVDRIVLQKIGQKNPNSKWTHINSIKDYLNQLDLIKKAADSAEMSLAEYELMLFSNYTPTKSIAFYMTYKELKSIVETRGRLSIPLLGARTQNQRNPGTLIVFIHVGEIAFVNPSGSLYTFDSELFQIVYDRYMELRKDSNHLASGMYTDPAFTGGNRIINPYLATIIAEFDDQ